MRRTRLVDSQAQLWPDWWHHVFVTDRDGDVVFLDADHRHHGVQELAIRDLKEGAGMAHCPSGVFFANAAWLVLATLAHNLMRWIASLGDIADGAVVAKTIRRRLLAIPGRLTRSARVWTLHLPTRWPWPPDLHHRAAETPGPPSAQLTPNPLRRCTRQSAPASADSPPSGPNLTSNPAHRMASSRPAVPKLEGTPIGPPVRPHILSNPTHEEKRWIQA